MALGARSKFGAPMLETGLSEAASKKLFVTLLGLFSAPRSDLVPP